MFALVSFAPSRECSLNCPHSCTVDTQTSPNESPAWWRVAWGLQPHSGPKQARGQQCTPNDLKKDKQILASHTLHSTFSKHLHDVLIPNHFKAACLSKDICSVFENENKVSARFNLFLSQISPPTAFAHPNWHC